MTIAVVGPTASGKSDLAMALVAEVPGVEIVSVDAMMVYRGMDIGTAKPTKADRAAVAHHLIDVADVWEDYSLSMFQVQARAALQDIEARGNRALLVGGTGLYLRSLTDLLELPPQYPDVRAELEAIEDTEELYARLVALDSLAASRMERTNRRRVVRALEVCLGSGRPFSSFGPGLDTYAASPIRVIGLQLERVELDARIDARFDRLLAAGFLAEVERLAADPLSRTARQALGYKELLEHVEGRVALDDAVATAKARTRRFARRQERWFRRDPRIRWVSANPAVALPELLREFAPARRSSDRGAI